MAKISRYRLSAKLKLMFGGLLVAILAIGATSLNLQALLQTALIWVDSLGFWGPVAFIVIYNLATILFVPGVLLTLGGGVLFGVVLGSLYVFIATSLGATFAFLIGRYLSRGWVRRQVQGNIKFKAINQAVAKEGFKIVFLTRLSPIFPFNLLNYAFGITQISLKDYLLGSLGMIPGTFMYVYLGSLAGNLAMIGSQKRVHTPLAWVCYTAGLVATIAVTIFVTQISRKALRQKALGADAP